MTVASATAAEPDRPARVSGIDKIERRRVALAESALKTLGELGYARTSLREIANNSEFTHGVVHYYFRDKIDLISYCVRYYKTKCARRYDEVVETAVSADELSTGFLAKMTQTLVEETPMHKLWYDLRAQSMFEEQLRPDVEMIDKLLEEMIWRLLTRYAELTGSTPAVDAPTAYALVDGLFEQAVVGYSANPDAVPGRLADRITQVLPKLVTA
ncbi:TetR/AcrR family transcriptional regulator [Kribbella solani]|uniref:AcrR family transcriptional regulator n=1 Tax=Kribbella solani TaxID=236067 RepID=A0A841DWY9_9ACTN|nr:TetR family transcriptional regulator [Kribbella solani]MBB5983664.1 AcrR family transcriptional regulator [Kribbella solani]MDX2969415.1 TetR/AcrR family transcriptional regulator [Kribbella solani]MDX3002928.1 TetR/AcrR family transcriptional regulator [Kribbella solani]